MIDASLKKVDFIYMVEWYEGVDSHRCAFNSIPSHQQLQDIVHGAGKQTGFIFNDEEVAIETEVLLNDFNNRTASQDTSDISAYIDYFERTENGTNIWSFTLTMIKVKLEEGEG